MSDGTQFIVLPISQLFRCSKLDLIDDRVPVFEDEVLIALKYGFTLDIDHYNEHWVQDDYFVSRYWNHDNHTRKYFAYKSVEYRPKNRKPWTVDNKAINKTVKWTGYTNLEEAIIACLVNKKAENQ